MNGSKTYLTARLDHVPRFPVHAKPHVVLARIPYAYGGLCVCVCVCGWDRCVWCVCILCECMYNYIVGVCMWGKRVDIALGGT